jgi:hypothetical protein
MRLHTAVERQLARAERNPQRAIFLLGSWLNLAPQLDLRQRGHASLGVIVENDAAPLADTADHQFAVAHELVGVFFRSRTRSRTRTLGKARDAGAGC